jgi:hypothetical protein
MKNPFGGFGHGLYRIYSLVFPMFAGVRSVAEASAPALWLTRLLVLGVVLVVLGLLNNWHWLGLSNVLQAPYPIDKIWLPLFALGLYATFWLGWWFWCALNAEVETTTAFPEIDEAWTQATRALEKAGILLHETPLFIILGQNADGDDALFQSAGFKPMPSVNQIPRDPNALLHVTANREAIYLTCPGISCLGQLTVPAGAEAVGGEPVGAGGAEEGDENRTIGFGGRTLAIGELLKSPALVAASMARSQAPKRLTDLEPFKAKLRYLCQLINRDRRGFCPINGVLLLIPITATDPKSDPDEVAKCGNADLSVMFDTFKVRCPVLTLIANLEKLPGFAIMLSRLQGQTGRRMGQRFPLVPDQRPPDLGGMIDGGIEWICQTLFPNLIYSLLREAPLGANPKVVVDENVALVRFLSEVRARQDRLSRLLKSAIPAFDEPLLFGGCYLAGTGSDPTTQQAFVSGVFKRMVQDQDLVSWTSDAIEADTSYRRLAHTVSLGLTLVITVEVLALAGLLANYFMSSGDHGS